jgi:SnoaL-like domain
MKAQNSALEDRQAIVDLLVDYCWALDSRQFADLNNIFHPQATAYLGTERPSRESIIEKITTSLSPLEASQHLIANHKIVITGDEAISRCYLHSQHVRHNDVGGPNYIIGGRYEDELIRTTQGWRILRRVLHRDWSEGNLTVVRPNG